MKFRLSSQQFAQKQAEVEAEIDSHVDGNNGVISHAGVTVRYSYSDPLLTVDVVRKPMMVPEALVESKIKGWFGTA